MTDAQQPEDLTRSRAPAQRFTRARLARPGVDLELDQRGPVVALDHGAHDRPLGADPHQWSVGGHSMAGQVGDVRDRLDQVGLALTVRSDEGRHPALDRQLHRRVGAEVHQGQLTDVHPAGPTGGR